MILREMTFEYIINIIIGLFLIFHGAYSLYLFYKGGKTIHFELPSTTYISKKIFGKDFDRWHNLFWGIIELFMGFCVLNEYIFN